MTTQDTNVFYLLIQMKRFSIYSLNGTRKLEIYSTKALNISEMTMDRIQKFMFRKTLK